MHSSNGQRRRSDLGGDDDRVVTRDLDDERAAVAKKNELRPHLSKYWKIPPDGDAAFVAAMFGMATT
jgi:hypothetical protein